MKDHISVCSEMTNPVPNELSLFPKSTLGIDLGDRLCHCCALDYRGEVLDRFRFETTKVDLAEAFENRPPCRVVLEVGTPVGHQIGPGQQHQHRVVYNLTHLVHCQRVTHYGSLYERNQICPNHTLIA